MRSAASPGAAVPDRPSPSCCSQGGSRVHPRVNTFTTNCFSSQVARKLQPSVVWIGDTEKTFYKKVPHAERKVRPSQWGLFSPPKAAPSQGAQSAWMKAGKVRALGTAGAVHALRMKPAKSSQRRKKRCDMKRRRRGGRIGSH